jgi:hypothetical protein
MRVAYCALRLSLELAEPSYVTSGLVPGIQVLSDQGKKDVDDRAKREHAKQYCCALYTSRTLQ